MKDITQTVTEKVKKYLNIQEDIDAFGLFEIVFECMRKTHPDQFSDDMKKEAEERFKVLNNFLSELKREIDYFKLIKRPSEIVIYEKDFEIVKSKNEVLLLENEIKSLKQKIEVKEYEIKGLNDELDKVKSDKYQESIEDIKFLYKPTKGSVITMGISSLLILFIGITTQFDKFYQKLSGFSPIDPRIINWILFAILVITFLNQSIRNFKKNKLKKICDKLISSELIEDFNYLKVKTEEGPYSTHRYFSEKDVEDFIRYKFCSSKYKKNLAHYFEKLFVIDDYQSINYLKNFFIDNLIYKKFISYGNSKDLRRNFIIK